jgi:hypothetical protein
VKADLLCLCNEVEPEHRLSQNIKLFPIVTCAMSSCAAASDLQSGLNDLITSLLFSLLLHRRSIHIFVNLPAFEVVSDDCKGAFRLNTFGASIL